MAEAPLFLEVIMPKSREPLMKVRFIATAVTIPVHDEPLDSVQSRSTKEDR